MLSIESGVHDPLHRPKLLLVDDDEVNLMLTAVALRERGFDDHRGQQRRDRRCSC